MYLHSAQQFYTSDFLIIRTVNKHGAHSLVEQYTQQTKQCKNQQEIFMLCQLDHK
jgi:hypothetical protein